METTPNREAQRLPWNRPTVQHLDVAVDTRQGSGTVTDGIDFDLIFQDSEGPI